MTLHFECEIEKEFPFDYEGRANQLFLASLDYIQCQYEAEVSILLTGNSEIKEINLEQRGIDSVTDVLSFPMADLKIPGDFSELKDKVSDYFNPETGELMLGDIVISMEKAEEQALEYGHSFEREFGFLVVHSLLHLFGFDHMEEKDCMQMEKMQQEILNSAHLTRC